MRRWLAVAVVAAWGCEGKSTLTQADPEARAQFPDLDHLYAGPQGIYRGCGPNGGVCHNGNEYPNLDSIGSIVDTIGRDCNQKRENPEALGNMCERPGDLVELNGQKFEIAYVAAVAGSGEPPRTWRLVLRSAPSTFSASSRMRIFRDSTVVVVLRDLIQAAALDPADPSKRTILLTLTPQPGTGFDLGAEVAGRLAKVGVPGAADAFRAGDPNRDGVFGAELGAKLIQPGDPQRSYLLRRLTDPAAGPLMPRANCCFWTKPALRAMWCWVAGLEPTGVNALAPIDYDHCPASPLVELGYPDVGDGCEAAGMCPPVATGGTNEPRFPSIYTEILVPKCGGEGCHDREPFGGNVDLRYEENAFTSLGAKLVPGAPDASLLVRRLDPATCQAPCKTMPLDRPPLPPADVDRIRQWISDGAARE